MPYYVYALHTDSNENRLFESFSIYQEADALYKEIQKGRYPGDNYVVWMMHADNDQDVLQKIQVLRKERQWPI